MVGGLALWVWRLMRETSGRQLKSGIPTCSYRNFTPPFSEFAQTLTLMGVIRPSMYRVPNKQHGDHGNNQARA